LQPTAAAGIDFDFTNYRNSDDGHL